MTFEAEREAVALAGVSSEFVFVAVLSGRLTGREQEVGPGEAAVWGHLGAQEPRVQPYSVRDLSAALAEAERNDLAELLEPARRKQERQRFWGLIRPTALNVATPLRPEVESVRRSYLTDPTVIGVKRAAQSPDDLPRRVAERFLRALWGGEAEEVAALLDPEPFEQAARQGTFTEARQRYAEQIVDAAWARRIVPGSLRETDEPLAFRFRSGEQNFDLQTAFFDNAIFVTAVREIDDEP